MGGGREREQIAGVEKNLKLLEQPGGIAMSDTDSGVQWDLPFGWAPASWIAIDGMVRVGDSDASARRRNSARPFVTASRMTGQSAKNTTSSTATPRWMSRPATKQCGRLRLDQRRVPEDAGRDCQRREIVSQMSTQPKVIVGLGELLWDLLPEGKQLGRRAGQFFGHVGPARQSRRDCQPPRQ